MRIAFLGTPDFAIPSLRMLLTRGHTLCVFTQPDKPQGRRAACIPSPVKELAVQSGIPVYQPTRIREPEGVRMLREFAPELMVTAAFGQILSQENLCVPRHGCINVHGSLLPKYRGAAPIQWAVIQGERATGITTMQTDAGLDTGDILLQEQITILPDETAGELYTRMAQLGAKVLEDTIARLESGMLTRMPQEHTEATKCGMLKKEDGKLDFTHTAQSVHNRVRGVNPWPGAYAMLDGASLKIWRTRLVDAALPENAVPGLCFGDAKVGLYVCCKDAPVEVTELQAPGGKRMEARAYLRGRPLAGCILA